MVLFDGVAEVMRSSIEIHISTNPSIDYIVQVVSLEVTGIVHTFVEVEGVGEGLLKVGRPHQIL